MYDDRSLKEMADAELTRVAEWLENDAPHVVVPMKNVAEAYTALRRSEKTSVRIEGFDISDVFNKSSFYIEEHCATCCCVAGALIAFGGKEAHIAVLSVYGHRLNALFVPHRYTEDKEWFTPERAARAIRSLIETGKVEWGE